MKKKNIMKKITAAIAGCLAVLIIVYCIPTLGLVKGSAVPDSSYEETIINDASGHKMVSPYAFLVNTFYRTANIIIGSQAGWFRRKPCAQSGN